MGYGIGIVGCGMIADFHAKAIADIQGAQLVGACSRRKESSDKFAEKFGCNSFENVEQLLADPNIDILSICTPSGAHLEPALAAIAAGKHVVVEKPLEVTTERCDQIIQAAKEANVTVSTIFPSRFHGAFGILRQAIEDGRFGRITMGDAYVKWFRTQEYYDSGAWRGTWDLDGGGALMNQAIHTVDLLLWLMGPVKRVSAFTDMLGHSGIEVEDVAVANLQFQNGALGVIQATTAAYPGMLKRIEIHGTEGSAVIEEESIKVWDFKTPAENDSQILKDFGKDSSSEGGASDPSAIGHQAHAKQFQEIIDSIGSGRQPSVAGNEGRTSVELIGAIYRAANTGQVVEMNS